VKENPAGGNRNAPAPPPPDASAAAFPTASPPLCWKVSLRLISCRMASSMSPHFSRMVDTSCMGKQSGEGGGKAKIKRQYAEDLARKSARDDEGGGRILLKNSPP
jgi:hypothetical protein